MTETGGVDMAKDTFAFILPDASTRANVFCHRSSVFGVVELPEGMRVHYTLDVESKGPRAEQVEVIL